MLDRGRDDGFTLIELLVTMVLISIVSLALGDSLLGFVQNTDATIRRLDESHDAQISAAYFAQDVASIGLRSSTSPYPLLQSVITTGTPPAALACGSTGTPVLRLGWDDPTTPVAATQVRVAYVVLTVSGERQLHRYQCVGSSTVSTDTILVHNLDTTGPTATCASPATCTGSGSAVPRSVSMVIAISDPLTAGAPYTITLSGQRRQT